MIIFKIKGYPKKMPFPLIIAHRGCSEEAPENTLISIKKAIEFKADFIEVDIHISADHVPVVIHDDTLSRTTNEKRPLFVSDLTLKELKELDAGSWFSPQFKGEKIPTLEEVLDLTRETSTGLIIEMKATNTADHDLPEAVLKILESDLHAKERGPIHLSSFSSSILKNMQKKTSKYPLHGIASDTKTMARHLDIGIKHICLNYHIATQKVINECHRKGIFVSAWTVDDDLKQEKLINHGIDAIFVNNPRKYLLNKSHLLT